MNLFSQLLLSLVAAATATFAILQFNLADPVAAGLVIAAACCLTPLLNQLASRSDGGYSAAIAPGADDAREEGEVKWFNVSKGFGFIRRPNGDEIFVHFRSISGKHKGRRDLRDGQRVSYVVVENDKGPEAEEVEGL